ncbi:hypothetical protein AB1Y20_006807 [Prymnesium parvum]|uniref:Protein xylosyltransferase n=1 Tax=Prymnesium parvum TaxID=97485 RepID=A0AB34J1C9_PRYPA
MSTAHVVLTNPFTTASKKDGPAPSHAMLRLHLAALAAVPTRSLGAVLAVLPTAANRVELPGYLAVEQVARRLPCPLEIMRVPNNTLGSYGMYLHAYAVHRDRFSYYIYSEVDYIPVHAHFDQFLTTLYNATFHGRPGVLAAVLQGRPIEDKVAMHLEGSHVMDARSLSHVLHHVYSTVHWASSTADRMVWLVRNRGSRGKLAVSRFDHIQEGFGLLMAEAGVEMRDWTSTFRSPYWNHVELVDWSGAMAHGTLPMDRVLFAPAQWLYVTKVRRCCWHTWETCRHRKLTCVVKNWRANATDCCTDSRINQEQVRRRLPFAASSPLVDHVLASMISPGGNGSVTLLREPPVGFSKVELSSRTHRNSS